MYLIRHESNKGSQHSFHATASRFLGGIKFAFDLDLPIPDVLAKPGPEPRRKLANHGLLPVDRSNPDQPAATAYLADPLHRDAHSPAQFLDRDAVLAHQPTQVDAR